MKTTIEDLYDQLGGMGKFQWVTSILIGLCQVPIGWSMLQMTFAGVIPEFHCLVDRDDDIPDTNQGNEFVKYIFHNDTLDVCSVNGTNCDSYHYETSARTVITEWNLVCDLKWVKKVIISIQMAGVLLGAAIAGQLSDVLGRKKILYSFIVIHLVLNIIAAFSVGWIMFSCMRFLIGMCLGAVVVVVCPFQMEFLPVKWRSILGILPSFTVGVIIFSGAAACLEDWSHLHLACAAMTLLALLGGLFVPESPRWLAVQGRIKDAEKVFEKISYMNNTSVPTDTRHVLQSLQAMQTKPEDKIHRYTYIDLFRRKENAKICLIFFYYWFILAVVYYGISFGVGSLSGDLYLNIFLLGIMEIPVQTTTFFLNNKIGRRKTTLMFYTLCFLSLLGCLLSHEFSSGETEDIAINVFSQIAKMMIGAAWSSVQVWGTELFPTVTRNLGCGFSSLGARVGGMLAPFIIDLDEAMSMSYGILCGLIVFGTILLFFIRETKGISLNDNINGCVNTEGRRSGEIDVMTRQGGTCNGIGTELICNSVIEDSKEKEAFLKGNACSKV